MKLKTKKDRTQRVREIIDANGIDVIFNASDTQEMRVLLETESDGFVKRTDLKYPSDTRHLHFLIAGKWVAKSWRKCITPISPTALVKKAFRGEIEDILKEFKESVTPAICVNCGSGEYLTVDHVDPPFDVIAEKYIQLYGLPKLGSTPEGVGFELFYLDDLENWLTLHAQHAIYQILCRSCNASKGKRKSPTKKGLR